MTMRASKFFVFAGVLGAVAGFLLIDDYEVRLSIVGNAMVGKILGGVPYRYVLFCSALSTALGLYRFWTTEKIDPKK